MDHIGRCILKSAVKILVAKTRGVSIFVSDVIFFTTSNNFHVYQHSIWFCYGLYPLKASENQKFSDVFKGCRNGHCSSAFILDFDELFFLWVVSPLRYCLKCLSTHCFYKSKSFFLIVLPVKRDNAIGEDSSFLRHLIEFYV